MASALEPNDSLPPYVSVDISYISLALLVLGVYICVFGQLSYWLKERCAISGCLSYAVSQRLTPFVVGISNLIFLSDYTSPQRCSQFALESPLDRRDGTLFHPVIGSATM